MNKKVSIAIPLIPHKSGVYQMFDNKNHIIYIGKAKDLFKRVSQYFLRPQVGKVAAMVSHVDHFSYIITNNEIEALILEMNLIHEHMPKYNILLKDNSHYPYIALSKNNIPLLKIARNCKDNRYYYFGPYPNSSAAYQVIDLLNKLFPLRKCKTLPKRHCLFYDLGECLAPCIKKIDPNVYVDMVHQIRTFLDGTNDSIEQNVIAKMLDASEKQNYEKANEYKELLSSIKKIKQNQTAENAHFSSLDVIAFSSRDNYLSLTVITYRKGILLGKNSFIVPSFTDQINDVIYLIEQYYSSHDVPSQIATRIKGLEEVEDLLKTKIVAPQRGAIFEAIMLCEHNAIAALDSHFSTARLNDNTDKLLEQLAKILKIPVPYKIDLIDNSHLQGSDPVSVSVTFVNGQPNKKLYRKYHIHGQGNDDFKSMAEIIQRRYIDSEFKDQHIPDLLLLDGGLPQLNAIKVKLPFPVYGLYKDDKHQTKGIIDRNGKTYFIEHQSPLFFLLMRMQDEVHRFAISFHIKQRGKSFYRSKFDDIPGLGPKRLEALFKHYENIDNLMKASEEELAQILSSDVAKTLYKKLHL